MRAQGDADAGGHEEFAALQHKRFDQAGEDLLGHMNGAVQRHVAADPWLQEQGEFVAAHARHGVVLGHAAEQARGHFLEHPVAGRVAEGVVDRLETVEVEEHQHHPRLLPFGGLQRGVQAVLEQGAVGQVGQGVIVGQAVDALLTGLALADIAEETHVTGQVAFVVEHRGNAHPGRVMLAIETLEPHLAFPGAVLVQLLEHITQMGFLLLIDGEHIGQLVEHIAHRIAADPAERLVGLHDITGRVGDQDRRGGMLEYRGRHAQVFFGAALLADIAAHAEDAFKRAMFIPHQHQAQFYRHLAPVGAQAVEQKQLGLQFIAQGVQGVGVAEGAADLFHQAVNAGQLLRVGNDRLPAVLEHPVHVIAQDGVDRGADVVEGQLAVGGADHVADAFGQHPVALFTVAQRFTGLDLVGNVLGHADDPGDHRRRIAGQGLFADIEAAPLVIAVTKAQLAVQLGRIADLALLLARVMVVLGVFGVQQDFPEVLTHLLQFGFVVAQGVTQMMVAENHALADHVLHIQVVGHGAHHIRPEAFTLHQRQLDQLAAGDVADAENHGLDVILLLGQTHHQPQVLFVAGHVVELDFQLQLFLPGQYGFQHLIADGRGIARAVIDQAFPRLLAGRDVEQAHGHLVDLGDAQLLEQLLALRGVGLQPGVQLLTALHLGLVAKRLEPRQVQHAQRDAGAFEDVLVASPAFVHLALATAHVEQHDHRDQRKRQAQQALADKGGQ